MCCWGKGLEGAAFAFGDEAVLFIYVSSGLAGFADSSCIFTLLVAPVLF